MTIELHVDGKVVKTWHLDYSFGPYPMKEEIIEAKEMDMDKTVLECKCNKLALFYNKNYQMYAVVRSALSPAQISQSEYDDFLLTITKNKTK